MPLVLSTMLHIANEYTLLVVHAVFTWDALYPLRVLNVHLNFSVIYTYQNFLTGHAMIFLICFN